MFIVGRKATIFVRPTFFGVEPQQFLHNSYLTQFCKILFKILHVMPNYTFQRVSNSNRESNMTLLKGNIGAKL